ncbi:MAG: XRE family transcriptional regulator, partial [Pseudomonadota bacterium]|nr:XRE family transcriptional regulator [Pseudomonadota bacterium]
MHEQISQKLVGRRVKAAREAMGFTQESLVKHLGLNDRQTISDIENGKRNLKPDELLALSDLLKQDIEYFINPFAVVGEAQFSWRANPEVSKEVLDGFSLKIGQWIGLLRWLREQQDTKISMLKKTLRLSPNSSFEEADQCAESLGAELDLGIIPADNLIDRIELRLDIPVLFLDTEKTVDSDSISGVTCHLEEMGVILINRNEIEGRRYFDMAHELFHALTWNSMQPQSRESNSFVHRGKGKHRRNEQLADNFAAALLMPRISLNKLLDNTRINDINHLSEVAEQLKV